MRDVRSLFSELDGYSFKDAGHIATLVGQAGESWCSANALASAQEEQRKNYLAKLTLEYMAAGTASDKPGAPAKAMPMSQADLRAQADPRYQEYIANMVEFRKRANQTRVLFDMGKVYIDMQRTAMANKRQELNTIGLNT